ncbi:tyrosine-protein phosphatase [Streptomyces sp. NPDC058195]|uniref:tyrosine-protein phosphatase n=1 Tax=Streptomyces sp. NPDC058195 TaxID=3346375 RepID=UPI0036EF0A20
MTSSNAGTAPQTSIDGVRNFRDAGGVGALPRGALFRSGALHGLTPQGAGTLEELGVRTVVDLRSRPEVSDRPDSLHGAGIRYLHVPVYAEQRWPQEQMELYPSMAEHSGRAVLTVLRQLTAERPAPVLVHCASGKDRTGVVIAVLQTLFGASEAEVTADFVRTNTELNLSLATTPASAVQGHNTRPVAPPHLQRALLWIRSHHGSLSGYLRANGAAPHEFPAEVTIGEGPSR